MIDANTSEEISLKLSALTSPIRMKLLEALIRNPAFVGDLAKSVGIGLVSASHHLKVLREAGLVVTKREGQNMRYSMNGAAYIRDGVGIGTLRLPKLRIVIHGFDGQN